jgi:AraC-like DNA-binding protein
MPAGRRFGGNSGDRRGGRRPGLQRALAAIVVGEGDDAIERIEVRLNGEGYTTHRHDTYAIGITLSGVQTFRYRGTQHYCLPGECHILHPDEPHDGSAADDRGFGYRIAYIDPFLIQRVIGGRPLPFVEQPVRKLSLAHRVLLSVAWDMGDPVDALRQAEIGAAVAEFLEDLAPCDRNRREGLDLQALIRVRERLISVPQPMFSVADLEREAGLDRWTLARQFRAAFGTSPTRFRTMRQLDRVRSLLRSGASLTDVSAEAGFADQCHMTRQFKLAYGCSPGKWVSSLSQSMF